LKENELTQTVIDKVLASIKDEKTHRLHHAPGTEYQTDTLS